MGTFDLGLIGGTVIAVVISFILLKALYNGVSKKLVKSVDFIADVALTSSASWAIENSEEIDTSKLTAHKQQINALLED